MSIENTPQADMPIFGQRSTCQSCQREIRFTGKYWEHVGDSPRHPAIPFRSPASGGEQQDDQFAHGIEALRTINAMLDRHGIDRAGDTGGQRPKPYMPDERVGVALARLAAAENREVQLLKALRDDACRMLRVAGFTLEGSCSDRIKAAIAASEAANTKAAELSNRTITQPVT